MKNVLENLSKNLEKIKEKKDAKEKKIKEALEKQAKQQKLEQIEKAEAQAKLKKKLAEKLENVVDKIGDSIIENTAEPIIENTAEPIIENTAEPIIENTAEPIIENTPLIEDKIEPKKDESYLVEGLDFGATKKPKEPNLEVHESLKDILTPAQIAALNSGITEADVESISGKADKTEIPSVRTIQTSLAAAMSMADGGADPVAGGSSDVDLSNYYSKTEADSLLSKKADKSALNNYALKSALNSKVDSSSVYTKDEVDTKLNTKANSSAVYNKTQVDSKLSTKVESTELANYAKKTDLNAKADTTSVYTKTEIDKKLDALSAGDIDLSTYATKVELSTGLSTKVEKTELSDYAKTTDVNSGLALKADKSDTYNKKEVDDLVAAASGTDMSAYATKTELNTKANSADVYDKTEIDTKLTNYAKQGDLTGLATKAEVSNKADTSYVDSELAKKANTSSVYTKAEVDGKIEAATGTDMSAYPQKTEVYLKTEINENYYTKTDVDQKIGDIDLTIYAKTADLALKADKTELSNYATKTEIADIATKTFVNTELAKKENVGTAYSKEDSDKKYALITNLETEITDRKAAIEKMTTEVTATAATLTASITANSTDIGTIKNTINNTLSPKITAVENDVAIIKNKIPDGASSTNQLTTKSYVDSAVLGASGRQLSANADGARFASVEALKTATNFYLNGTTAQPKTNDYAVVSTSSGDMRYNFTGSEWVEYQLLNISFSESQQAALDSGVTGDTVSQVAKNKTDIANRYTIAQTDATFLKQADFNTAKLALEAKDTELLASLESEKSRADAAEKKLEASITTNTANITTNTNDITKLKTDKADTTYVDSELAKKANSIDVYKKTETYSQSEVDAKIPTTADLKKVFYEQSVVDNLLGNKADKTALTTLATKTELTDGLSLKANTADIYDNATIDSKISEVSTNVAKKANSSDVYKKTETYNQTEIDNKLATKLTSADLTNYVTQTKLNDALSTYATDDDLNAEITKTTTKITTLDTKVSDFITEVQGVQTNLNAKDTELSNAIDAINAKIPNTASNTNQLADKDYVKDLVQKNAARGLSANASGDSFTSKAALESGPWYYQGTQLTAPHQNDYAIVTADALNDGNDVRYNYDGAGWIKFQVYQSGAGFDPSTTQLAAINSGITSTEVVQISSNKTDIAAEKTARETADTGLLAKITAEQTARESGDNDIKDTYIGALGSLTTTDKTSVVSGINSLKTELNDSKVSKTGDTMSGTLKIAKATNGELIELEANGSGVQFIMDGDNNTMGIVPVKAKNAGFNIGATTMAPRLNNDAYPYSMGSELYPWTNAHIKNLKDIESVNGTQISDFLTQSDLDTNLSSIKTQVETNKNDIATNKTDIATKVSKSGDTISGPLILNIPAGGDLISMVSADKGITFNFDSSTGHMRLVPVSNKTLGFEFTATTFMPSTSAYASNLGSASKPWSNVYATNLSGTPVSDFVKNIDLQNYTLSSDFNSFKTNEFTPLETLVATNAGNITTETTNRKSEDATLLAKINTEVSDRKNADTSLQTKISDETTARTNAINDLKALMLAKETIVNMIYPVGAVIHTFDRNYDPATTLGVGTWEKIKEGVFLEASTTSVGEEKQAGLPNIEGYIENYDQQGRTALLTNYGINCIGAFSWEEGNYNVVSTQVATGSGACHANKIRFNASNSSAVYGGSTTVQPHSITVIIWKRTA